MYQSQKFSLLTTFKWTENSKRAGEAFVIVACAWSVNRNDWMYTVRYFSDGRFRRYTEGLIERNTVGTGVFEGDALKGASEAELADIVETKLHGSEPVHGGAGIPALDALARVQEFNPFEVQPEPAKRLAKVYDIMDACAKKFGTDSTQFKDRMHWYDTIDKVGFKKAVGLV